MTFDKDIIASFMTDEAVPNFIVTEDDDGPVRVWLESVSFGDFDLMVEDLEKIAPGAAKNIEEDILERLIQERADEREAEEDFRSDDYAWAAE